MGVYNVLTILVVLAALFGYINLRFVKLPVSIGVMLLSAVASLIILGVGSAFPQFFSKSTAVVSGIDFETIVMKVMLSFLLFAAGIQVDIKQLRKETAAIVTFATVGVLVSTIIVGLLLYLVTSSIGLSVDLIYCFLFGSLISPTDPVAVMGILKKAKISPVLETRISGESLFNDGMAVVLFITFFEIGKLGVENTTVWNIVWLFVREGGGGILLGILLGYGCFYLLKSIDNYVVEVLVTLAIVMGGYLLADQLLVSGPIAMVIAGLITGNKVMHEVMSDKTRDYLGKFWELIDALMNSILFLLMGLTMLVLPFNGTLLFLGLITVVIVLFARLFAVSIPILVLRNRTAFEKKAIPVLTWGALRGAISVALALSVPKYMYGQLFVSITYVVVLFSILVQGLTIKPLAKSLEGTENSMQPKITEV